MTVSLHRPFDEDRRIPVNVLTGFLGSGKTTLLRSLLRAPQLSDTAVLVNEFGEVGLDHHLIERVDEGVVLLQSGCICCTIRSDLRNSLRDLLARRDAGQIGSFCRLVIETTGLADPTPIVSTLLADPLIRNHFRLGNTICTVDSLNGDEHLDRQPESVKQVAVADRLVLTKTDLDAPARHALERRLRRLNPTVPLLWSAGAGMDADTLLAEDLHAPRRMGLEGGHGQWIPDDPATVRHDHGHDNEVDHDHSDDRNRHDARIRAFALTVERPLDWSAFGLWLSMLLTTRGDDILRVKGLLEVMDSPTPVVIHGVQRIVHPPVHLPEWPTAERGSRIVFIVRDLDRNRIERSLRTFLRLSQ